MIGATQPEADDHANYAYVAEHRASRGEPRLKQLEPTVLTLYKSYWARVRFGPVPYPFSPADQSILAENADYLRLAYFSALRSEILASTPTDKCAYCFQIRAYEVDHYLPKSPFGEYAIYAPNLVPICTACNGKKSNRYKREDGGRRYIHPYMDELGGGSANFLVGVVSINESVVVEFEIVQPTEIDDEIWQIVNCQFDDLDLLGRYKREATEEMTAMLSAFYAYYEQGGAAELNRQLTILKRSKEKLYGANHWWVALFNALIGSDEFCDAGFKALGSDPGLIPV